MDYLFEVSATEFLSCTEINRTNGIWGNSENAFKVLVYTMCKLQKTCTRECFFHCKTLAITSVKAVLYICTVNTQVHRWDIVIVCVQCSEVCGGGEQQRIVACSEEDACDRDLQPSNIQSCNSQPCAQWLTGSWAQVYYTYTTLHTHTLSRQKTRQKIPA